MVRPPPPPDPPPDVPMVLISMCCACAEPAAGASRDGVRQFLLRWVFGWEMSGVSSLLKQARRLWFGEMLGQLMHAFGGGGGCAAEFIRQRGLQRKTAAACSLAGPVVALIGCAHAGTKTEGSCLSTRAPDLVAFRPARRRSCRLVGRRASGVRRHPSSAFDERGVFTSHSLDADTKSAATLLLHACRRNTYQSGAAWLRFFSDAAAKSAPPAAGAARASALV